MNLLLSSLTATERRPASSDGSSGEAGRVLEILENLSVEQRQALVLVDFLGFTTEEAGRILGIRASSVRGRMHRARATLRLELRRADD